jgi:hypothetical protein
MKMTDLSHNLIKWMALIVELVLLFGLCVYVVLVPGLMASTEKIVVATLIAAAAGAFAYLSSTRFRKPWDTPLSWRRVILAPPFSIWFIAILFVLTYQPNLDCRSNCSVRLYRTR